MCTFKSFLIDVLSNCPSVLISFPLVWLQDHEAIEQPSRHKTREWNQENQPRLCIRGCSSSRKLFLFIDGTHKSTMKSCTFPLHDYIFSRAWKTLFGVLVATKLIQQPQVVRSSSSCTCWCCHWSLSLPWSSRTASPCTPCWATSPGCPPSEDKFVEQWR